MTNLKPLPFLEAIRFFRDKGMVLSPDSWRDVWASAHVGAFTVARVTSMDMLEDIRSAVQGAIKRGTPLGEFKKNLIPLLERKGWFSPSGVDAEVPLPDGTVRKRLTPWRLDTIYRTNLQSAYQTGRYRQMLENAPNRPWWMYDAVNDSRTRPSHAAMDGKVYRFDHPVWDRWYPPNGYNCRCVVRTLSGEDMKRTGKPEQIDPPFLPPDEGFDYNPGMVKWKPDLRNYSPEAMKILTSQGIGRPGNTEELAVELTRARDAMKDTGMLASEARISIKLGPRRGGNGSMDYSSGLIWIRGDWLKEINKSLSAGKVSTQKQMNAYKTLVHEFGHHLGKELNISEYRSNLSYKALAQTVNDTWARHKTGSFLRMFGLPYKQSQAAYLLVDHPTGYQISVDRFRSILRAAGIDEAAEIALVDRLNLSVDSMDYSNEMWKVLKESKPDLKASGHFGRYLENPSDFDRIMEEFHE